MNAVHGECGECSFMRGPGLRFTCIPWGVVGGIAEYVALVRASCNVPILGSAAHQSLATLFLTSSDSLVQVLRYLSAELHVCTRNLCQSIYLNNIFVFATFYNL